VVEAFLLKTGKDRNFKDILKAICRNIPSQDIFVKVTLKLMILGNFHFVVLKLMIVAFVIPAKILRNLFHRSIINKKVCGKFSTHSAV
jgi:hypothetical protein